MHKILSLLYVCLLLSCQNEPTVKSDKLISPDCEFTFGIDVSHHVGKIDWQRIANSHQPVKFAFMRATKGIETDETFSTNWKDCKESKIIAGAYHYLVPDLPAEIQFQTFSNAVKLSKGDLPPVLDVEEKWKNEENMIKEIKIWLKMAEQHYKIKPILYCGLNFFNNNLEKDFNNQTLWIAAYSGKAILKDVNWTFHQFTNHQEMVGMNHVCDGNEFRGSLKDLRQMCIK